MNKMVELLEKVKGWIVSNFCNSLPLESKSGTDCVWGKQFCKEMFHFYDEGFGTNFARGFLVT
jgi:hypothetical protein